MRQARPSPPTTEPRTPLSAVAIIPARYGSSRFPGKPLADLCGRPLIEHVYRRTAATPGLRDVIVATDDARIADVVHGFGGRAVMTRSDHPSGTDRLAEAAAALDADIVVNVQGDEPLIEPAMIETALRPFSARADVVMTTLRRPLPDLEAFLSPHVVKVVVDRHDVALYFSRAPIPFVRDGRLDRVPAGAWQHIGLYAYRRACLLGLAALPPTALELAESLEQLRALEHGIRIVAPDTPFVSVGVDTPEDLDRVRRLMETHSLR
ncbi:MAG: 3-deoxy-manno-octulosonate cytidylyltransferase [Vicinamibacterales bacterium]